jgi:hypothetical protein
MTRLEIQRFAQQLPADGPYYQLVFRDQPDKLRSSTPAQRITIACADPALGLHVAQSYARAGLPLPDIGWPCAVLRAYAFFREPNSSDINVRLALQLNDPEKRTRRDLLRGTLVCLDNTLQQIADRFGLSLDVLSLFEALTWNCRDRGQERMYLAQICQVPGFGRGIGWPEPADNLGCDHLRIAYNVGRTEAVLAEADLAVAHSVGSSVETLQQQILDTVLSSVLDRLKTEKVAKEDNPLLEPVLSIIASSLKEKPAQQQTPVQGPSPVEAIKSTFQAALAQAQPTPNNGVALRRQPLGLDE